MRCHSCPRRISRCFAGAWSNKERTATARPTRRGREAFQRDHADYIDARLSRGTRSRTADGRAADRSPPPERRVVGPTQLRPGDARVPVHEGRARRLARPATSNGSTTFPNASSPIPCARSRRRRPRRPSVSCSCSQHGHSASRRCVISPTITVIKPRIAKERVAELVEAGDLVQVPVEGWAEPGYTYPGRSTQATDPHERHVVVAVRLVDLGSQPHAPPVRLRLPHRGVHARAEARVRVLRAPAPPRRSARCALRPQGRSQGVGPPRSRFVSRTRRRPRAPWPPPRRRGARHAATLATARPQRGRATWQPRYRPEPRSRSATTSP